MNKYLAKGVASALLITTVAGGMMLAPINQDAEATAYYKSKKLCSHTTITAKVDRTSNKKEVKGEGAITITSSKNKNSHTHTEVYTYTGAKNKKNQWEYVEYSTGKYTTKTYNSLTRKTTTTIVNAWTEGTHKKIISAYNKKVNKKFTQGKSNSFYSCSECKLTRKNAVSNYTVKCPYCTKKATINYQTGAIS